MVARISTTGLVTWRRTVVPLVTVTCWLCLGLTQPVQTPWINVKDYQGTDTTSIDSHYFNEAIDDIKKRGGRVLYIPQGKYVLGTIELCNNTQLYIEAEGNISLATLLFLMANNNPSL